MGDKGGLEGKFMIATRVRQLLLPIVLAAGLGACASNAVQPGVISTSAGPPGVSQGSIAGPAANATALGSGRVVSVREIAMQGGGGGVMTGGMLGAAGGMTAGALISQSVGGSIVGLVLGAVAGGIAGAIYDGQQGAGRGIEVVVQRDDGQNVTIAQRDDGDVQLGDRVQIVQDQRGVARAVRDVARNPD
jgi:outer membrane lipoprotein SlyB